MSDDFKRNVRAAMAHGRRLMEANPGRDPMKDVEAASRGEPFEPWIQPPVEVRIVDPPPDAYWTCGTCGYKQLRSMSCYCATFEEMRREWSANQNIATAAAPQGKG